LKLETNKSGRIEEIIVINDSDEIADLVTRHDSENDENWKKRKKDFLNKYKDVKRVRKSKKA